MVYWRIVYILVTLQKTLKEKTQAEHEQAQRKIQYAIPKNTEMDEWNWRFQKVVGFRPAAKEVLD